MFGIRGEGEKEITNQGWLRIKSFSQETGAEDQQAPRIGVQEPKLKIQCQLQDAKDTQTQLPFFLSQSFVRAFENFASGTTSGR